MTEADLQQATIDGEHLRLLSLGYMISAAVTAFFSLFGLMYMVMGLMFSVMAASSDAAEQQAPPEMMGWLFAMLGAAFFVLALALAAAKFLTARYLRQRRSPLFCQVVAGLCCLSIPYGTALGVCTFLVLGRPRVQAWFAAPSAPQAEPGPPHG
jgi:vacuolar-type H+-ATPase subunit I/STV1